MDPLVRTVLSELERRSASERAELLRLREAGGRAVRDAAARLMLDVGPEVGAFLNLLVHVLQARTVIEVGASVGYSTLWLAEAARATGGRVYSFEIDAEKRAEQVEHLARAGLSDVVDSIGRDPTEVIPELPGPFDLVLLDHWKELYEREFRACWPRVRRGGAIVADNVVLPRKNAAVIAAYLACARAAPRARSTTLPLGDGLELTVKL